MKKVFEKVFVFGFTLFVACSFFGCGDSMAKGLGAAVDTEPPTISINYPDYDVVIRDSFYVVGECFDDKLIESVKVWITNTRNEEITDGPFTATLSKKKIDSARDERTWYVLLNEEENGGGGYGYNKKWTYPDGNYIVKAIAYDKAGRQSGEASHTYIIDNTPPFMVLKSPGITAESSIPAVGATGKTPTPYGANFKVEGTVIENNDLRTMKVDVFPAGTEAEITSGLNSILSAPLSFNNINIAGSTTEIIASARTDDTKLLDNYKNIYNYGGGNLNDPDGSKERYCQLTLIDGAKAYKDNTGRALPSGDDAIGNQTNEVFINDLINSALKTEASGYALSDKHIAQILNDTYQLETSEGTVFDDSQKDKIKTLARGTSSNLTAFSIDPDANPKFNISGYSVDSDAIDMTKPESEIEAAIDANVSMAIAGQTLNATIVAGRDNYYILPETLTYYLFGPYKVYPKDEMEKIYKDPAAYYNDSEKASYIVPDDPGTDESRFINKRTNNYNSSSVESYNWELKLPATIKANSFYVVAITGKDQEGLDVYANKNKFYVLRGSNNIAPPTVTLTEVNGTCYGKTDLTFHGTAVSSSGMKITDVCWKATLTNFDTGEKVSEIGRDSQGKGKSVTEKTPAVAGSTSSYNWTLSLEDTWPNYATLAEVGKTYTLELTVWAEDETENESVMLSKAFDIDTTSPSFVCSDFGIDSKVKPNFVGSSNIQYQNEKYTLRGTVSDDKSGILAFYYRVDDGLDVTVSLPTITRKSDGTSLTEVPTFIGWSKIDGKAKIEKEIEGIGKFGAKTISVFCVDKVGNVSKLEQYSIVFDDGTPGVAITTPDVSDTNELASVVAEIDCNNLSEIANLSENINLSEVYLYDGSETVATYGVVGSADTLTVTKPLASSGKQIVSYSIPAASLSEKTYEFKVVAKNKSGSAGSSEVMKVMYDKTKPIIESTTLRVEKKVPTGNYFNSKSLTIEAKYTETGSGIDKIKYTVTPVGVPGVLPKTGDFSAVEGSFSTILAGFDAGENILTLTPVDKAGNEGDVVSANINVDLILPTVSDATRILNDGSEVEIGTSLLTNGKQPIKIKGFALDDIGIDSISLLIDGTLVKKITKDDADSFVDKSSTLTEAERLNKNKVKIEWLAEIPTSALVGRDGKQVSIDIKDKAENSVSQAICKLLVDTHSPTCTVSTATNELNGSSDILGKSADDKTMVSIELYYTKETNIGTNPGQALETASTTEVKSPADYGWIRVRKDMASATEDYAYTESSDIYNWKFLNFPFDLDTTGAPSSGSNVGIAKMYFLPVVIDEAGNSNAYEVSYNETTGATTYNWKFKDAATLFNIDLNADKPLIKFENLASDKTLKYVKGAVVRGIVTDDDSNSSQIVREFIVSEDEIPANGSGFTKMTGVADSTLGTGCIVWSREVSAGATEKTTFNPKTGKWKFEPSDPTDGSKDLWFYVLDNKNDVSFTTKNGQELFRPRIQFNDQNETDAIVKTQAADKITYNSDSETPQVDHVYVATSNSATFTPDWVETDISSATKIGGTKKRYAVFKIIAKDANGIHDLKFTFTDAQTKQLKTATFSTNAQKGIQDKSQGGTPSTWITDVIDFKDVGSGLSEVIVTPTDNSEMDGTSRYTFFVDNEIPLDEFRITSPASTIRQTDSVTVEGYATDGGGIGIATNGITWAIPKFNQNPETVGIDELTWIGNNTSSELPRWEFIFDGNANRNPMLRNYITNEYFGDITTYGGSFNIPLLFKIEDELGNIGVYRKYTVKYEPDMNLPTTTVDYPLSTDGLGKRTKVGRNIRIMGSTSCILPLEKAYVQLAVVANETDEPDWTWVPTDVSSILHRLIDSDGLTVKTRAELGDNVSNDSVDDPEKHLFLIESNWWGIEASGNTTWNLTVNKNSLTALNEKYLCIRACSVVNEGTETNPRYFYGPWSEVQKVAIDSGAPQVGRYLQLVTFPDGATAAQISSGSVSPTVYSDITAEVTTYVSRKIGNIYLAVSAEDESGIGDVKVSKIYMANEAEDVSGVVTKTNKFTDGAYPTVENKWIYVPIDMTNDGRYTYSIDATEYNTANNLTGYCSRVIYVDNTAPALSNIKGNSISLASGINKICDSNYVFNISGDLQESGSGFDRVLFYFYREGKVYLDPIWTSGSWTKETSKVNLSALEPIEIEQGADTYTVYGNRLSGTQPTDKPDQFTSSGIATDPHVKVGGLIYIGEKFRLIKSISGNTVTFDSPTASGEETTAILVYGQVIDNLNTIESTTNRTSPVFEISSDDGDGMPEKINMMTNSYSWSADIHTTNLPDGPAKIAILAFDKSGNVSQSEYDLFISNNPPRLAKLYLGTDLNQNGSFSEEEFETYNFLGVEGFDQDDFELTTNKYKIATLDKDGIWRTAESMRKSFKIKNKLAVVPEFTGGNGEIKAAFKNDSAAEKQVLSADATSFVARTEKSVYGTNGTENDTYILDNTELGGNTGVDAQGNPKTRKMSFTFWDSTEELTCGEDSQYAFLRVMDFIVNTNDETPSNTVVNKFFWKSLTNNSLYKNSKTNGHIELESDLTQAIVTEYGDRDPKVSGKITIRGTAYDDTCLGSIWIKFDGFTPTNSITDANVPMTGFYKAAVYNNNDGSWTYASATMASDSWEFNVISDTKKGAYFGQDGHKVLWELSVDTSKITNVAALNRIASVIAVDLKGNKPANLTPATTDKSDEKYYDPSYQMDVVPYITGIQTKNRNGGGLKDDNIRSASGKYSIIKGTNASFVTINGFNLNPTSVKVGANTVTAANVAGDRTSFTITNNLSKSGLLEVETNSIRAPNNINKEDAKGDYEEVGDKAVDYPNMYNREPDLYKTQNILLNDDRYIRVFDIRQTNVRNGYYPTMIMDGDDPVFSYIDQSGGQNGYADLGPNEYAGRYYPSHAMPQRGKFSGTLLTGTQAQVLDKEYLIKASAWDQMAMAKDDAGRYYHASLYNRDSSGLEFVYDRYAELYSGFIYTTATGGYYGPAAGWGSGTLYNNYSYFGYNDLRGGNVSFQKDNNALTLDSLNYGDGLLLGRYQYPKIIAKGNSVTDAAKIFMCYYDDGTGELCFRNFLIGTESEVTNISNLAGNTTINALYDSDNIREKTYTTGGVTYRDWELASDGGRYKQYCNFNENEQKTSDSSTTLENYNVGRHVVTTVGSKDFAIGVIPNVTGTAYRVVIVWYESNSGHIKLVYSANELTCGNPTATISWIETGAPFNEYDYIGNYLSMAIDDAGGIHIAALDASDSNLAYMYLPSYDSTDLVHVTVDQAFAVGNWTQIKVKGDVATGFTPYIAYYNATEAGSRDSIKLAKFEGAIKGAADVMPGVDENSYTTGYWEYMTVTAITPPQGGSTMFQNVCLDFDSRGEPVIGYLGTNLEFGKALGE